MKQLLNPLFVVVLVIAVKLLHAQSPPLAIHFEDITPPHGWWEISTNPYAKWNVGKIPVADILSADPSLHIHRTKGYGDDLSIMTSASYQLPTTKSLWLSLKFTCKLKDVSSIFRLELWDGKNWNSVYAAHRYIDEELWFDLSKYHRADFQMKFIYKSKGYQTEYVTIDDVQLHTEANRLSVSESSNVQIYPNPVQSRLKVIFNSSEQDHAEYQLADMSGKIWKHGFFQTLLGINEISLDVHELPRGIYILSLLQGEQSTPHLISKQ